jgi:hypothetical protein
MDTVEKISHKLLDYLYMVLQSFSSALVTFQFLNPMRSLYDSLNGGSARRKTATYTQNNTHTK